MRTCARFLSAVAFGLVIQALTEPFAPWWPLGLFIYTVSATAIFYAAGGPDEKPRASHEGPGGGSP